MIHFVYIQLDFHINNERIEQSLLYWHSMWYGVLLAQNAIGK